MDVLRSIGKQSKRKCEETVVRKPLGGRPFKTCFIKELTYLLANVLTVIVASLSPADHQTENDLQEDPTTRGPGPLSRI